MTPALGLNKAVLVCAEPQNMDLVIGQDLLPVIWVLLS